MNYINKLRKLGFKRCEPSLVCEYDYYTDRKRGKYIESANSLYRESKLNKESKKSVHLRLFMSDVLTKGFDTSGKCKIQSYKMVVCEEICIYVTILGDKYWSFIENNLIQKQNVQIIINGNKISDQFWIEIQSKLDLAILRQIRLKSLFG